MVSLSALGPLQSNPVTTSCDLKKKKNVILSLPFLTLLTLTQFFYQIFQIPHDDLSSTHLFNIICLLLSHFPFRLSLNFLETVITILPAFLSCFPPPQGLFRDLKKHSEQITISILLEMYWLSWTDLCNHSKYASHRNNLFPFL